MAQNPSGHENPKGQNKEGRKKLGPGRGMDQAIPTAEGLAPPQLDSRLDRALVIGKKGSTTDHPVRGFGKVGYRD